MENPLVSVIIPAYNCAEFLLAAVESILHQHHPIEIIVVDDGSTDETAEIVKRIGNGIRYIYQNNKGPASARNTGLKIASGEFIGFLDADDLWPSSKIKIQLTRLKDDSELEVVMGRIQYIRMPDAPDINIQFEGPEDTLAHIHLGSGLFRKSVFDKVGLFDESLIHWEDHDWFLRAREMEVYIKIVKDITLHYRVHKGNMSHNEKMGKYYMFKALKKSLERRREKGKGQIQELSGWFEFDEARKRPVKDHE